MATIGDVPAQMQMQFLAEILEVDRVIVGRAKVLSNQEGGTASLGTSGARAPRCCAWSRTQPAHDADLRYTYRFGGMSYRNEVIPDRLPWHRGRRVRQADHDGRRVRARVQRGREPTGYLFTTVIS